MRNQSIRRAIALIAVSCLILPTLVCGGLWLAARQRVVELPEIRVSMGPLRVVTQAPQGVDCPPRQGQPLQRYIVSCQQYKAQSARLGGLYRVWVFASNQRSSLVTLLKLEFKIQS